MTTEVVQGTQPRLVAATIGVSLMCRPDVAWRVLTTTGAADDPTVRHQTHRHLNYSRERNHVMVT